MKTMLPVRFRKPFLKIVLSFLVSFLAIVGVTLGLSLKQTWLAHPRPGAEVRMATASPGQTMGQGMGQGMGNEGVDIKGTGSIAWLRQGDRGPQVQKLHQQLKALGYDVSQPANQFDGAMAEAVFSFQRSMGIGADGIVGPETDWALEEAIARQETPGLARSSLLSQPPRNKAVDANDVSALPALMPPDIQRILDRGKLVVAVLAQDNPPFFLSDRAGTLLGSDVAIAQQLADQLGVGLAFNRDAQTFNEVVDEVYAHRADLAISKISRTLKRAQRVSFSAPYLSMRQGLLVNRLQFAEKAKGDNTVEMLRTLEGRIGVIEGSSYGGFAKQKFPEATVVEYPTWSDVVKAVTSGEVIAAYRDELEVKKIVFNNPDASLQFQTVAFTDTKDPLAVVLPWDSRHLNDFVNQYLEDFNQDYTVDGLLEDYLDYL